MRRHAVVAAAALAAAVGLARPARSDEILVFGAASLTESLQELGKAFGARTGTVVRFSLGASSDLARQIKAGAPADVFFSADTARMDDLERAGFVRKEERREFLSNRLVVVVPSGLSRPPAGPAELAALPRIALADPEAVPAGIYAKKWLESIGLWEEVRARVVPMLDVRAALAAVETEAAPAAIVYRTDAAISKSVKVAFEVRDGPRITYSLAPVAASKAPSAARAFVDLAAGETGRAVFEKRGFVVREAGPANPGRLRGAIPIGARNRLRGKVTDTSTTSRTEVTVEPVPGSATGPAVSVSSEARALSARPPIT